MTRPTFARNKAPTRSYWRGQFTMWLCSRDDLDSVTAADFPCYVAKMAPGEPEQALASERARRAARDAA